MATLWYPRQRSGLPVLTDFGLPLALAAQNAALADLTVPSSPIAAGRCSALTIPRPVKEFQAVVMVVEQTLHNETFCKRWRKTVTPKSAMPTATTPMSIATA